MRGFMCGVGNWVAGLAGYEITACKSVVISQQAIAALANAPQNACRDGFVYIPAGAFVMGSEDGSSNESPVRTIYLDAYCITKSETTNAQYNAIVKTPRSDGGMDFNRAYQPVINVNWKDADAYCKGIGGRLPTEAEWEKAARGPKGLDYGTQSGELDQDKLNYRDISWGTYGGGRYAPTASVCLYPANDYGLCDMTGNVSEWTNDWFAEGAYELMSPQNPKGPDSGASKVLRGGRECTGSGCLRAAKRGAREPDYRDQAIGFRCVVAPQVDYYDSGYGKQ